MIAGMSTPNASAAAYAESDEDADGAAVAEAPAAEVAPKRQARDAQPPAAPGQPPRRRQQSFSIATAQVEYQARRREAPQRPRQDGGLAHDGIDPRQVAARCDGGGIGCRQFVQPLALQPPFHAAMRNCIVSATRPRPKAMAQPGAPAAAFRISRSSTNITVPEDMLP